MLTADPAAPQRTPRRARYLIPPGTPRRAEVFALLGLALTVASLLVAPAAAGLTVVFHLLSKLTRWRPWWLSGPAAGGLVWTLAAGPARAAAGFAALPRAAAAAPGHLFGPVPHTPSAGALAARWLALLPGQLPLALPLAAGAACAAWWLDWLHTDEWRFPPRRPGLVAAARRRSARAIIGAGGVLSREGVRVGADADGRMIEVSWQDIGEGLMITGAAWPEAAASGFAVLHGAIRRRKPVIAVDCSGSAGLAAATAALCRAAGAPMQVFGDGGSPYEPWRVRDPDRLAALLLAAVDWRAAPPSAHAGCRSWLADVAAVAAGFPPVPGDAVLDDIATLLTPQALRARAAAAPAAPSGQALLAQRADRAAAELAANPEAAGFLRAQLAALRTSSAGRWLGPSTSQAPPISLAQVLRRRGVALFCLEPGAGGGRVASVVAADAASQWAALPPSARPDALVWLSACDAAGAGLLRLTREAGGGSRPAAVVITCSAEAAAGEADQAGTVLAHRLADPALAATLAALPGSGAGLPPGFLLTREAGGFTLLRREGRGAGGVRHGRFIHGVPGWRG